MFSESLKGEQKSEKISDPSLIFTKIVIHYSVHVIIFNLTLS